MNTDTYEQVTGGYSGTEMSFDLTHKDFHFARCEIDYQYILVIATKNDKMC